jgi:hypothetical protein
VAAALLLARQYSRGGGRRWCCYGSYWHSLRFQFVCYFRSRANRFSSLGLWLVTTHKAYHCKNMCCSSTYQEIESTRFFREKQVFFGVKIKSHPSHTRFSPFYHGGVLQSTPLPALTSQHICWLYLNVSLKIANKLGNLKKQKQKLEFVVPPIFPMREF